MQYCSAMTIYTVGYEGISLEDFIERVRRARVQRIVDVRDIALSRKRGFSKTSLSAALGAAGLQYQHIRELGCPKPIRDRYRADGDWGRYTASFMSHLREHGVAVSDLAQICATSAVALLCYEADPNQCHRTYVATAVARVLDSYVVHIGPTGTVPDQATVAAARRIEDEKRERRRGFHDSRGAPGRPRVQAGRRAEGTARPLLLEQCLGF